MGPRSSPEKQWYHVCLPHARKDSIDLYVRNVQNTVEAIAGDARTEKCFSAEFVLGEVEGIRFDQRGNLVPWKMVSLPGYCRSPEVDSRHNEMVPGYEPTLDALKYSIANAMNRTLDDRGFSTFVKKRIPGVWKAQDSTLDFAMDGVYRVVGSPVALFRTLPVTGRWFVGGNMLHLMNEENSGGVRTALVSISETELRFHGVGGALFHVYER
jgi:hypothetical protein